MTPRTRAPRSPSRTCPASRAPTLSAAAMALAFTLGCGGASVARLPSPTQPLTRAPDEPFRREPPRTPPGPALRAPVMTQTQLANGLTLIVVPRPGWPTVSLAVVTRATELDYEPGALDLAAAYIARVTLLRQPDTQLGFGASLDGAGVSGAMQTRDVEAVLSAVADAIQAPLHTVAMQQARAELMLDEEMSASSPLGVGRSFAAQSLYLPAAEFTALRRERYRAIANIAPPLVSVVARDAFAPPRTAVVLVGDITSEGARALVEPRFGGEYAGPPVRRRAAPSAHDTTVPVGVQAMRSSQLQVVYGLPAPDLASPDWAAYQVLEAVLAGGFTSSLNTRIRHELGASYGVRWGSWASFPGRAAFIEARLDTERAALALQAFFAELQRVRSAPLAEAELERARRVVWGEWENSFSTPSGLLGVCERAFLAGVPVTELAARAEATRHVSAAEVHAVAAARLDPARNVLVLAGALEGLHGYQIQREAHGFTLRRLP
ncbi:MAG: insulinase family protein [Myxococcales bacterium]|nr:insulinase family protein [Myxococcales bacterium]